MPRPVRFRPACAALLTGLLLAACGSGITAPPRQDATAPVDAGAGGAGGSSGFGSFPDIALPAGTSIDLDRSLVLGAGREWTGRLAFTARGTVAATYDYFRAEMPKLGWTEVTSLRAATSILVFNQGPRIASIQIVGRTFGGVGVELVMAPRGSGGGVSSGGGSGTGFGPDHQGGGMAAPSRGTVEQSPLPPPRR